MSDASDKPIIAVTAYGLDHHIQEYVDGVERSNGEPWVIFPEHGVDVEEFMAKANALVLTGGEDVHPSRYDSEPLTTRQQWLNEPRDVMEFSLLRSALNDDMPVYAICRGVQLLNVALGGTLVDVEGHKGTLTEHRDIDEVAYHRIFISPGSKLAAVVGSGGIVRVNSIHNQGMREAQKSPLLMAAPNQPKAPLRCLAPVWPTQRQPSLGWPILQAKSGRVPSSSGTCGARRGGRAGCRR